MRELLQRNWEWLWISGRAVVQALLSRVSVVLFLVWPKIIRTDDGLGEDTHYAMLSYYSFNAACCLRVGVRCCLVAVLSRRIQFGDITTGLL